MSHHPAIFPGRTAVITGASSGIGLAAAKRFAELGLNVCLVDIDKTELNAAIKAVTVIADDNELHEGKVLGIQADVSDIEQMHSVAEQVFTELGDVAFVMNNAATGLGAGAFERYDEWKRVLDVNLWGVINGVHAFVPHLIEQGKPALVVNTGSKQGITCPPGNAPYNVSKAAVKTLTETLQHELRNTEGCSVSAHLLVPGWTNTSIGTKAQKDRALLEQGKAPKTTSHPADGAWSSEQVVDFMLAQLAENSFYIICPDNEVTFEMDKKRIAWAAGDIIENRPPMSRWHPDYAQAFKTFSESD